MISAPLNIMENKEKKVRLMKDNTGEQNTCFHQLPVSILASWSGLIVKRSLIDLHFPLNCTKLEKSLKLQNLEIKHFSLD